MRPNTVNQFMEALCNTCRTSRHHKHTNTDFSWSETWKHKKLSVFVAADSTEAETKWFGSTGANRDWSRIHLMKIICSRETMLFKLKARDVFCCRVSGAPTSSFTTSPRDGINNNNISSGLYRKHIVKSKQLKCPKKKVFLKYLKLKILRKNLHQNFFHFLILTRKQNLKKALKLLKLNILILLLPKM